MKGMDRYQEQWENLGGHDPYWAVLSDPAKKGGKWGKEEFFESGRREIEQVVANLARLHVPLRLDVALDFGCGVGRLSRALSVHFERVIGVDVSGSMLDEARAQNHDFPNLEFLHNVAIDLRPIPSNTIDFVYSNIVLQHMPAERQRSYIGEFCRVLRPGGVAVFQTPSRYDFATLSGWIAFIVGNRLLNVARRTIHGKHAVMEFHALAKDDVLAILGKGGMSVAEIERYDVTGPAFVSYRYYAVRR